MSIVFRFCSALLLVVLLSACSGKALDFKALTAPYIQPIDTLPLDGDYGQRYHILQKDQELWLHFSAKKLNLEMRGEINSQRDLQLISYDAKAGKVIAYTEQGVVLVLFVEREDGGARAKIYIQQLLAKHNPQSFNTALKDAHALQRPAKHDLNNRGWQTFYKDSAKLEDQLEFSGSFSTDNPKLQHYAGKIKIADHKIWLNDTEVEQLSYYRSEQRFVGKVGNNYVLIFFDYDPLKPQNLQLSLSLYENTKYLYTAKRDDVRKRYWSNYTRLSSL